MNTTRAGLIVGAVALFLVGCGSDGVAPFGGLGAAGGGAGAGDRGGVPGSAGAMPGSDGGIVVATGGAGPLGTGGAAGGPAGIGGSVVTPTGGTVAVATGGIQPSGGAPGTGGHVSSGGAPGTGGAAAGGHVGTGGIAPAGTGGMIVTSTGGTSSGGSPGTGGAAGVCRPGEVVSCQGDGCLGTTTCTPAATWGACFCPPPGTGGAVGSGGSLGTGGAGTGGAAGAGGTAGAGGQGPPVPWCARPRPDGTPAMCPTVPLAEADPRFFYGHYCDGKTKSLADLPNLLCYSGCANKDTATQFTATCFTPFPYSIGADGCPNVRLLCVLDCSECS